jgi:ubiquinone/menaquinone biosynthesis C-methylase UbiE
VNLSPKEWHQRFKQQARWTQELRHHLYRFSDLSSKSKVLEVGCGTGAVLQELETESLQSQLQSNKKDIDQSGGIYGLDIDINYLKLATNHAPNAHFTMGDAINLPYASNSFEITFCHYLLLWVGNPGFVLSEMLRVTKIRGTVIAFAEPDYGGRIDYPPELAEMGNLQRASLLQQGADPLLGRRLLYLFNSAGLKDVETGVIGGQWKGMLPLEELENEWAVFQADISSSTQQEKANSLRELEENAWLDGSRVLYVPTFYALGSVIEE